MPAGLKCPISETNLTFQAPIPQNGKTHLNSSLATADELFESVWPFCGVGAQRVKTLSNIYGGAFGKNS